MRGWEHIDTYNREENIRGPKVSRAARGDFPYGSYQDNRIFSVSHLNSYFSAKSLSTAYVGVPKKSDEGQQEDDNVDYELPYIEIQNKQRHHRAVEHEQSDSFSDPLPDCTSLSDPVMELTSATNPDVMAGH